MSQSILRLPEVKKRTGLGRASIYSYMKAGTFPLSFQLGTHSVGWLNTDIDAWIESRIKPQKA